MGFIDVHIHGIADPEISLFRWSFTKGGAEASDADDGTGAGIAPAPVERDGGDATDETDESGGCGCGSGKLAAVGLVVVLGFLVATGLLVKRKLGGGAENAELDDFADVDEV